MIKIVLSGNQPIIRAGIRSILSEVNDIEIGGETPDLQEAQKLYLEQRLQLLLMSFTALDYQENQLLFPMRSPNINTLVLLTSYTDRMITDLISIGIKGILLADESSEVIKSAIRALSCGSCWYSKRFHERVYMPSYKDCNLNLKAFLGNREIEVLKLLGQGLTNEEIAQITCLSERTVRHYVEQILSKLNAPNRTKAVVIAIKNGWL